MRNFFIVGCPRSGTTMLQQALNRHSKIVLPPETKYFYYFYRKPRRQQLRHLERLKADLGIDLPVPARIVTPEEAARFYQLLAELYVARLHRDGVELFGDKTPEHTAHLRYIKETFPDAKIIFLYRDGRDVALSLSRVPWIKCDVFVGFVIWLYYYRILKSTQQDRSLAVYWVRYEDLVVEPERQLAKILEFLGTEYQPSVAEGAGNSEGIPQREYAWKHRALRRIENNRVGLWRRELASDQLQKLERLGHIALPDLGYELSNPHPPRLTAWFLVQLYWQMMRCAARLPVRCLANEFAGSVVQFLSPKSSNAGKTEFVKS